MRAATLLVLLIAAPLVSGSAALADGETVAPRADFEDLGPAPVKPSFDCKKAQKDFEIAICQNPYLAKMDKKLDDLYRKLPEGSVERRDHIVWNNLRKECGTDAGCIFDLQKRSLLAMSHLVDVGRWLPDANKQFYLVEGHHGWKGKLPKVVGECTRSAIGRISDRFAGDPSAPDAAGTSALFTNGLYVVTYSGDDVIINSKPGDPVELCLASIPEDCPPGDDRGREYNIANLRTHGRTRMPDSQHLCGGP